MNYKRRLEDFVQKIGMGFSFYFFSDKILSKNFGKKMYILLYSIFKNIFESDEMALMANKIGNGSTVVDIGANVGVLSLFFLKRVGSEGRVIAIEPDPIVLDLLRYNLSKNKAKNVDIFPVACGKEDGFIQFSQNLSNRADNRIIEDKGMMLHRRSIAIQVRAFSTLCGENPEVFKDISFIKIDVQGYELEVIDGMQEWFKKTDTRPYLCIELWPYGLLKAGNTIQELLDLISISGYEVTDAVKKRLTSNGSKDFYETVIFNPIG